MELENWHIWIIIAIILFITEIFTPAFLAACLGIGCLFSSLLSYWDFGVEIQFLAFSIGTLLGFFAARPFILRYGHHRSSDLKTNTEALIGVIARVIITIDNHQGQGRVTVMGDDWKAESENNEIINAGEKVLITKVNSTILTVKQIKNS